MYICLFSLLTAKFAIDHQSIFLMREVSSGESIRSVNVTPLDLPLRCARLDVPAFPPTVLTLANVFSPSRHRCFLLLFRPSSDPLFSQSSFTAGIIIQN